MNPDKFLSYSVEEIVPDQDFIHWVLHPDKESDTLWKNYLEQHPDMKNKIRDAAFIVRSLQPVEPEAIDESLNRVLESVLTAESTRKHRIVVSFMKYAAGILLILAAGTIYYVAKHTADEFPLTAMESQSINKGRIILADGTSHEFDTDRTNIRQSACGKVLVNDDTLVIHSKASGSDRKALNRIIIPYGKRSEITLSDGTHIWLNSGSQISYPAEFRDDTREVYLSGEAYFDVSPDVQKPFIVFTKDIRIRVLGTSFNVSSYSADNITQTVLVNGAVKITQNGLLARSIEMKPGERVVYNKTHESFNKDRVNVELYSSWIDGYLIFDNEPTSEIIKRLERIYNQRIIADPGLSAISFSGKLDLQEDIKDVLDNIAFASGLNVSKSGEYFIIKP